MMICLSKYVLASSLSPVSLMRLSEISDPDELLKKIDKNQIVIEHKYDGWRVQVIKETGKVRLFSRRGEEKTGNFPKIVKALTSALPDGTLAEGELVYWYRGKQDVTKVQSVAGSSTDKARDKISSLPGKFKLHLYDVLWLKGVNISKKAFSERRKALQSLIKPTESILLTKQYTFDQWEDAMNSAVESGGEGIVLKLKDKPYEYKSKGETEPKPKGIMFKYKGGAGKSDSDDYVIYDYETTEKGNLKAFFGQYYKGKLYHISEISNFSEEDEATIRKKLQSGSFVIEIGFQERVPGGLRHQKFERFRDDKKPKDATMHEFHAENIEKFKTVKAMSEFQLSKRAKSLTPQRLLVELQPEVKPLRGMPKAPSVPPSLNFNPELGFRIMSTLESGRKSWVRGDSGNSFGLTQVHGPYFMRWLSRHPQLKRVTGIDPSELRAMSDTWKKNLRSVRKEKLWKTVPVDQDRVREFIKKNPRKVVRRREGTTIRMNPRKLPGVVKKVGRIYVGREIDIDMLERKYVFKTTPLSVAQLQRVADTYITPAVASSAVAQLLTSQDHPETSKKFYDSFSSRSVRKNKAMAQLSDWVSRSDFMAKMRFLVNDVIKHGYNPNASGAYNMYQLMCITNGSGPYRVRRFLKNRKVFGPGHVHYLQRANPVIQKMTGLSTNVIEGGLAGFPDVGKKKRYAFLSKRGQDDFDMPDPSEFSGQAEAIRALVEKWLNRDADLDDLIPFGVKYIGKDIDNKVVYITMSKQDVENIKPFMPEQIGEYTIKYQYPLTEPGYLPDVVPLPDYDDTDEEEPFTEDSPTRVDPLSEFGTKYYKQILEDYEWYVQHMKEVIEDLDSRYGRKHTRDEAVQAIVNTLKQKYKKLLSESRVDILLQKCASYVEPGTLYFPGQYAEDIKSGKRRMSIRPGDVNVKPDEHVKCKTYSGADIADVRILAKKIMSVPRIEKNYGKAVAKSLSRRFGPDKRFVLIEFEPMDINVADDGDNDDKEKLSEVLIDKDKKLTRGQIKKHYMKPEIRKKIMSRIKGKPVLVYIGVGKNESILKRNHKGKEIVITNDDPKNDEQPNNYFYWVKRRLLSFHQVFGTKTSVGFVDLDIHGDFSLGQAKKYARELAGKIKSEYGVTPTIYESGGTGLHVEFKLGQEMSIDKLRGELKELLTELNEDWEGVTTGVVKGSGMRSDISTLHNKGSIRVPGSLGESNGNEKKSLGGNQDTAENNYRNAPLMETKYDYTDPSIPFPEGNIIQVAPPQGEEPHSQHGAYNTLDDAFALSKRHAIKKKNAGLMPEKEYIWVWDPRNERLLTHLNISNGEETDNIRSHMTLADEHGLMLGFKKEDFRGYVRFFENEDIGEVHLYQGDPNSMPYKLRRALEGLSKDEYLETKEMELPRGAGVELWRAQEKQRQLDQHLEKRKMMGFEEADPEFVKQLEIKFASVKKRVAMLLSPTEFYESEYFIPRKIFVENYGFTVHVISTKDTVKGAQGTVVNVDKNLSDLKSKRYDALFVCGGKGMIKFSKNKEAQQLLKDFIEQKKPVGLICHAPLLAAEADVIRGREVTGWPDIVGKIKRAKGLWTGMPIERAGTIFTAVGPEEAEDLAYIISQFLLGKNTLKPTKKISQKEAQEKLEQLWKIAANPDDEEVKKWLEEHPEFAEEEEEGEEIETEQERFERAIVQPQKPEEPEEVEEPGELEEEDEEIEEEVLKERRPKYVGFKHVVKPETEDESEEQEEEPDYAGLFGKPDDSWEETMKEYKGVEEGEEEDEGEKIPVFGVKLKPPMDKNGNVLTRWFEPEEIERPFMSSEAKDTFNPDNMRDGPALTKLFQDPDAWRLLKENPEIAQKWVLPAVIMGIGKKWFDNNSTQLRLGGRETDVGRTPFGMFDTGDIELLMKGTPIYDLPSSKAYISLVNELVTDLANTYFSYGYRVDPPRGSLPIGGFIYKSLARQMSKNIASDKGFKEIRVPVCSYCKSRKQKRQSKEVVYHGMEPSKEKKGPKRWYCEECKRKHEENVEKIAELRHEMDRRQKQINMFQKKLTRTVSSLADNPTQELMDAKQKYEDAIVSLATDIKHARADLANLEKTQYSLEVHIQGVPYWHTWCPEPECPGNRVPLTAVDRKSEFWKTEAGVKAAEVMEKRFGITVNPVQKAEEYSEEMPKILPQRVPPEEILDVPFICPHDYVKFTLRSARGKGLQRKGGFFWEPWQHMKWDRIGKEEIGVEEEGMGGIEADQEENRRNQIVQRTSMYLSALGAKLFEDQYETAVKEYNKWFTKQVEIQREKGKPVVEAVKKVEQSRSNGAKQRLLSMYQTLGETSHLDPGMFVSWLSEIGVDSEFVADGEGNVEERNVTKKIKSKERRDNVYIPTLHSWVSKMIESRDDWFEHYKLDDILANKQADGIYSNGPGTFFIAKVGDEVVGDDVIFGFGCNLVPAHKEQGKVNPFSYRMKKEDEDWTLPQRDPKKRPLRYQTSMKPKVLKFIGVWKLSSDQMEFIRPEWLDGTTPVPLNNKVIEYAKDNPGENLAGEIMYSDYYRVALNKSDTSVSIGDYILVQALVMPGKYNPEPVVDIRNIRNKSDTHQQIFSKVGALMNEKPVDEQSKALLKEFFEDIENYGDDPEEMKMCMEDLVRGFEDLKKKRASFYISKRAKDPLSTYKKKRNFDETTEPEGVVGGKNQHRFVIQRHKAEKAGCFPREVRVITENGPIRIGDIVKNHLKTNVLSFSHEYGLEWKPIVGWFENGSTSEWIHVKTDYNYGFVVTKNHKIYKICNNSIQKCKACDIISGDYLFIGDEEITQDQFDFMIGSLLGDASITKSSGLVFSYGQSTNEKKPYIDKIASMFGSKTEIRFADNYHKNNFYYLRKRHKINHLLYDIFYDDKKVIKNKIFDFINERVLAVWFMDDGQWSPARSYFGNNKLGGPHRNVGRSMFSGQISLYTNGFTKNDNIKLIDFLKNKFGLHFTLRNRFDKKQNKTYYWLSLSNKKDIEMFFNLVFQYIDKRFQYKCPIEVGNYNWDICEEKYCLFPIKVSKIDKKSYYSYNRNKTKKYTARVKKFDIEVADNHNYFAGGILVSNSHFDLRLENDEGTMSSWAIPKHKLPKGKEKLLAVKTEDHPLSYRSFKGEIPSGYGKGKMDIHDSGTYEEIEGNGNKIVFKLKGKKEKGTYKIFKTDGKKWMIMEDGTDDD
jgi:DNA ligase D-like protein (predicted 3'-phosphoesterase)